MIIRDAYEYYHPMNGNLEKIAAHPDTIIPAVDPAPPVAGADYADYLRFRDAASDLKEMRARHGVHQFDSRRSNSSYYQAKTDALRTAEINALHGAIEADPGIVNKPKKRLFYSHRGLKALRKALTGTDYDELYRTKQASQDDKSSSSSIPQTLIGAGLTLGAGYGLYNMATGGKSAKMYKKLNKKINANAAAAAADTKAVNDRLLSMNRTTTNSLTAALSDIKSLQSKVNS